MSEPLSTTGLEDVVSSVRRLVSTEPLPRATTRELQDKLLLTPALRVVPEPAPAADPLILTVRAEEEEPVPDDKAPDRLQLVDAEWEDEIWSEPVPPLAERALEAEEAEVLVSGAFDAPAADDATPWPEAGSDWQEDAAPASEVRDLPDDGLGSEERDPPEEDVDVADVLAAAVVEDEAFRPLDPSELHAMVRAMVREELQGSLGERITRNVRKLVRAEINRALAARDLD